MMPGPTVPHGEMQAAWDRASATYLARRGDDVHAISYGNLAPSEAGLHLLGDLRNKAVLDLGCGGGHNAVACALAGAAVAGVDISERQLAAAQRLAHAHRVNIQWRQGDVTQPVAQSGVFDLVLAIQLLPYMEDSAKALAAARQALKPGGTLVVSFDHPLRNCFYDEDAAELSPFPVRDYHVPAWLSWHFAPGVPMRMQHQPLGTWITWIVDAGFALDELVEAPAPRALCDELWPEDSPLAPLRHMPHTAILLAHAA